MKHDISIAKVRQIRQMNNEDLMENPLLQVHTKVFNKHIVMEK